MERYKEIERTIIKTYRARIWVSFIRSLKEYEYLPGLLVKMIKRVSNETLFSLNL